VAFRDIFRLQDQQELSTEAVRDLIQPAEALRSIDRQARRSPVDSDSISELERVLADELLSRQVPGVSADRRKLLLESMQADSGVAPAAGQSVPDLSEVAAADTAFYYFVSDFERVGYLRWNGRSWRWHLIREPDRFRQDVQTLSSLLQQGYSNRARTDALVTRLSRQVGLTAWDGAEPSTVYILADPMLLPVPWSLLPVGTAMRPLGEVAGIVLLQSLVEHAGRSVEDVWLLGANPPDGSRLASLPALTTELERIRRRWSSRTTHSVVKAGLADLVDALSTHGALVHVASHGLGDTGSAEESGLWVRGSEETTPAFVSALRLRELDANASLVVLSACESGKSAGGLSLGAGGVAGSLVDAGVAQVIGNRWDVSDRTASQFAEAFHAGLAKPGGDSVQALKHAISELRANPATAHPRHWAGWFILQSGPTPGGSPRGAER